MDQFLLLLGIVLLLVVLVDGLWTTLALERAGPIAGRVAGWLWKRFLSAYRRVGSHAVLAAAGTVILCTVVLVWAGMLWAGWTLVFSADPAAVVDEGTGAPAGTLARAYFVGYTLVTLGIGDFVPQAGWRVVTVVCALHGLFELTLAISYLLPVLGSATEARQIAASVSGLGDTPQAILTNAWTGQDFGGLGDHLRSIGEALSLHTQAHKAYPALHYFHAWSPETAPPLRIAVLDEALTMLAFAVPPELHPTAPTLRATRHACTGYLRNLKDVYVAPADEAPPAPDLAPLREAGIPVDEEALARGLAEEAERRRLLLSLVRHDGWAWEDVTTPAGENRPERHGA